MKKLLYTTVLLFLFVGGAYAQVETTAMKGEQAAVKKKVRNQDQASLLEQAIPVELLDIPDGLRMTLQENKIYRGWENSTIYFVEQAKQYLLHLMKANKSKIYRFDETGKPIMAREKKSASMQKRTGR